MLHQKQEQEAIKRETARIRWKWGWLREQDTDALPTEQVEDGQAQSDEIESRLTALQRALQRRKRFLRMATLGAGLTTSGLISMVVSLLMAGRSEFGSPVFWPAFWLIFGGEAIVIASLFPGEKAFREAVSALARTDDLRAVGPLAEVLMRGEPSYSLAVSALTRLLPRMQPSDAELLNETQRACLRRALKQSASRLCFWRYNPHFAGVLRRALTTLGALSPTEQAAACDLAEQRLPGVEASLEQFQAAVRQRQKNTVTIGVAAALGAATGLANMVEMMLTHQQSPLLVNVAIGSVGITLALSFRGLFRLKAMMNALANTGDLRVVGALIEIAAIQDGYANPMAACLLTRLLPHLQASDAALLTDRQRVALGRALIRNVGNVEFLLAALKALEQVGDGRALSVVESLAAGKIGTADPKRVQAAAQECLPFLQTRNDQQRASQTLLRASCISETPPATLLRPAQGAAPMEDAELLRPGISQPESKGEEVRHDAQARSDLSRPSSKVFRAAAL